MNIIHYGIYTPFGTDIEKTWEAVLKGKDAFSDIEGFELDGIYQRLGAEIKKPVQGKFEYITRTLLEQAEPFFTGNTKKTALALATTLGDIKYFAEELKQDRHPQPDILQDLTKKLAYEFSINGPVSIHTSACTAATSAIAWAEQILSTELAEQAIILAIDILSPFIYAGFSSLKALTPDTPRPFDRQRNGFIPGEGGGCMVLVKGKGTYSIEGTGSINDGYHITAPHREARGMIEAIKEALGHARLNPEDIDLVISHGTSTKYNDAMEYQALNYFFAPSSMPYVMAFKPQLGHCFAASVIIEAVLALYVAKKLTVLPIKNLRYTDSNLPISHVNEPTGHIIKNILKLSNAFGGNNAAMVLRYGE